MTVLENIPMRRFKFIENCAANQPKCVNAKRFIEYIKENKINTNGICCYKSLFNDDKTKNVLFIFNKDDVTKIYFKNNIVTHENCLKENITDISAKRSKENIVELKFIMNNNQEIFNCKYDTNDVVNLKGELIQYNYYNKLLSELAQYFNVVVKNELD